MSFITLYCTVVRVINFICVAVLWTIYPYLIAWYAGRLIDIYPLFNSLVCARVEGESISKYGWVGDESEESLDTAQQLFMSGDNTYISIGGG